MPKSSLKEKMARRDARAKVIKMCGVCLGRGHAKKIRNHIVCWACNGSGLNCSMQRAYELEMQARQQPDTENAA